MSNSALIRQAKQLSPAERLELIGAVWETFPPELVPVSEAERALLDARLADLDAHPDDQSHMDEVRERLRRQLP